MGIITKDYGITKDGKKVTAYVLENINGMQATFLDYGAIFESIMAPDRNGNMDNIILGYGEIKGYEDDPAYMGAFIGRVDNRIAKGKFKIGDKEYQLDVNNGCNYLHGGYVGYNNMMYEASTAETEDGVSVTFSRMSPDMEQGFPGNLEVKVTYTLTNDNAFEVKYYAKPDQDTPVNFTQHMYFNLAGHASGDVLDHKVQINADMFAIADDTMVPTGELVPLEGTPLDFRTLTRVGDRIRSDYEPIVLAKGYDHTYMLNKTEGGLEYAATLIEESTGRKMELYTDLPAVQLYTANYVDATRVDGTVYSENSGICFEAHFPPNSCNIPHFPNTIVKAGETFEHAARYCFSTIE